MYLNQAVLKLFMSGQSPGYLRETYGTYLCRNTQIQRHMCCSDCSLIYGLYLQALVTRSEVGRIRRGPWEHRETSRLDKTATEVAKKGSSLPRSSNLKSIQMIRVKELCLFCAININACQLEKSNERQEENQCSTSDALSSCLFLSSFGPPQEVICNGRESLDLPGTFRCCRFNV
jgi:hypothetical protein